MKNARHALLALLLLALAAAAPADEDLYKSGLNVYIRLTEQEDEAPPNQHPVNLNAQEITNALNTIEVWEKKGFFSDIFSKEEGPQTVFSPAQAGTLGLYLAQGLARAGPQQDIVFTLVRHESGFLKIRTTTYTAGRAFYADDRLHVILGDFAVEPDRFQEQAYKSSGISEIRHFFSHGRRKKPSDFKYSVMVKPGIEVRSVNGKVRPDWFVINVPAASATYVAEQRQNEESADPAASAALAAEAERLAQERRELRLEMARMRKEMRELSADGGPASGDGGQGIEERMRTLNALYEKKLITPEEYEAKRREILGDI